MSLKYTTNDVSRFWSKVDCSGACWLWTASKNTSGYGHITINHRLELAHRVSYEITHGAIPPNLHVLHTCDVRHCVNPAHMFLGTNADNVADRHQKGRTAQGDRAPARLHPEEMSRPGTANGRAQFTNDQIREIRQLRADGLLLKEIALIYQSNTTCIFNIVSRKTWKHI